MPEACDGLVPCGSSPGRAMKAGMQAPGARAFRVEFELYQAKTMKRRAARGGSAAVSIGPSRLLDVSMAPKKRGTLEAAFFGKKAGEFRAFKRTLALV